MWQLDSSVGTPASSQRLQDKKKLKLVLALVVSILTADKIELLPHFFPQQTTDCSNNFFWQMNFHFNRSRFFYSPSLPLIFFDNKTNLHCDKLDLHGGFQIRREALNQLFSTSLQCEQFSHKEELVFGSVISFRQKLQRSFVLRALIALMPDKIPTFCP